MAQIESKSDRAWRLSTHDPRGDTHDNLKYSWYLALWDIMNIKITKHSILLLVISFVNSVTLGLLWPFITINIYMLGGSLVSIVFVQNFPYTAFVFSRLWGVISDFYGKRKLFIIVGQSLSVIPLFFASFTKELTPLISLIILANFFSSIASPSFLAALGEAGGGTMYAYSQLAGNIGWTLGALIIGPLHSTYGQSGVYLAAITALLVSICIFSIFYRETKKRNMEESMRERLKKVLSFKLRARKQFKYFLLSVFLAWLAAFWSAELLKVKLFQLLGESVENYSIVFGFGVGSLSVISSYITTKLIIKYGGDKLILLSLLMYSILNPLLGIIHDPTLFIALFILPIWPMFWAGQTAVAHELSDKGYEAENMGMFVVVTNIAALPGILGGVLADLINVNLAITFSGFFFTLSLFTYYKAVYSSRFKG